MFWLLSLFGLGCAVLAKATCVYSIATEIKHPMAWVFRQMSEGRFNTNNLFNQLMMGSGISGMIVWLFLFALSISILHYDYKKNDTAV